MSSESKYFEYEAYTSNTKLCPLKILCAAKSGQYLEGYSDELCAVFGYNQFKHGRLRLKRTRFGINYQLGPVIYGFATFPRNSETLQLIQNYVNSSLGFSEHYGIS